MSRFFGGFDDLSDSSDSENNEKSSSMFSEGFVDLPIYNRLDETAWEALSVIITGYCGTLNFNGDDRIDRDDFSSWLEENLKNFNTDFDRARFCLVVQQYFYHKVLEYDLDDEKKESKIPEFLKAVLPIRLLHHNVERLGVIEFEYEGKIVAYIKAGVERQQQDAFLVRLDQFLRDAMRLDNDFPPLFPESIPVQIAFSDIQLKENQKLPVDDKIRIGCRDHFDNESLKVLSVANNTDGRVRLLSGGMQAALPNWEPQRASNIELLQLTSVMLLLAARDLKEDGIKGTITVIDCEEFLEKKTNLPDLNIPAHFLFSDRQPKRDDWQKLWDCWSRVDENLLEKFMTQQRFNHRESMVHKDMDQLNCLCKIKKTHRTNYVDANPDYVEGAILSQEQIKYLDSNLQRLKEAIKECAANPPCDIFGLLKALHPKWAESETQHMLGRAAVDPEMDSEIRDQLVRSFDEKELQRLKEIHRSGEHFSESNGLRQPPMMDSMPDHSLVDKVRDQYRNSSSDDENQEKTAVLFD